MMLSTFIDHLSPRRLALFNKIKARCSFLYSGEVRLGNCWVYEGANSGFGRGGGYGRIYFEGGWLATHIAMWVICFGPIPSKKQIDHLCKRRACCNPEHLECVTHKQNQRRRRKAK